MFDEETNNTVVGPSLQSAGVEQKVPLKYFQNNLEANDGAVRKMWDWSSYRERPAWVDQNSYKRWDEAVSSILDSSSIHFLKIDELSKIIVGLEDVCKQAAAFVWCSVRKTRIKNQAMLVSLPEPAMMEHVKDWELTAGNPNEIGFSAISGGSKTFK